MLFQGDAPEGSDTFQWPVIERDRVGGLRLIIWDKVKVPLCQTDWSTRREWPLNCMTVISLLMTIKHSISKIQWAIMWALNYYLTQLSSSPRSSCQEGSRQLETRCGRESHTWPRGSMGTPMEWTPASGEQERHNVTGSRNYSLCLISSSLSHATLEQPFRTLAIKWEVKYICKEVFLCLPSFMRLNYSVVVMLHEHVYVYISIFIMWVYNNFLQ